MGFFMEQKDEKSQASNEPMRVELPKFTDTITGTEARLMKLEFFAESAREEMKEVKSVMKEIKNDIIDIKKNIFSLDTRLTVIETKLDTGIALGKYFITIIAALFVFGFGAVGYFLQKLLPLLTLIK
jgi:septal ring factor EnvC (AmiA/AmiB activator)